MIFKGTAWKFGDNIPTDVITPITIIFEPIAEIVQHVVEAANPEFKETVGLIPFEERSRWRQRRPRS